MSASLKPISLDEFLVWERAQELRYEFDGIQPIAMTGASAAHERLVARIIIAAGNRVKAPCEVYASGLKVISHARVRYPDVTIACGPPAESDEVTPTIVFEVLSPSSTLTDRRVKPLEYQSIPSIQAYVILNQDSPEATLMRRNQDWATETIIGHEATIALPEISIELPMRELYR